MDNKNTVIALVLMLVVWLGFSILFPSQQGNVPGKQPGQTNPKTAGEETPAPAIANKKTTSTSVPSVPAAPTTGEKKEIVVDTPLFRAVFSNIGAQLENFELKKYYTTPGSGIPVRLVDSERGESGTLLTKGEQGIDIPDDAYYSVSPGKEILLGESEEKDLVFTTRLPSGLVVSKVYSFHGDRYDFNLKLTVANGSNTTEKGVIDLALVQPIDEGKKGSSYDFVGAATLTGGKVEKEAVSKIGEQPKNYNKEIIWTSFGNKYFLTAIVPLENSAQQAQIQKVDGSIHNILETPVQMIEPGDSAQTDYLIYLGPRDLDILKKVDHQLAEAVDFGFFSPIAKPLLHVLKFFYSFLGNYGLAIILLTVIIKLLFWPLTQKSYSSMKNMQKLQPEMQKLRERFKKDRERLNREIMELYRKHRVNPLGGCLPMVVQIPVFFALYKVLLNSIELRHAPFYFWITDLSAKDPYYITPIIMGATMFIQQKMTPSSMDPTQAKLFMLMPVVFTFMFLNFPSGLVIYWLVNNILTIGQQFYINKKN